MAFATSTTRHDALPIGPAHTSPFGHDFPSSHAPQPVASGAHVSSSPSAHRVCPPMHTRHVRPPSEAPASRPPSSMAPPSNEDPPPSLLLDAIPSIADGSSLRDPHAAPEREERRSLLLSQARCEEVGIASRILKNSRERNADSAATSYYPRHAFCRPCMGTPFREASHTQNGLASARMELG